MGVLIVGGVAPLDCVGVLAEEAAGDGFLTVASSVGVLADSEAEAIDRFKASRENVGRVGIFCSLSVLPLFSS